MGIPGLRKAISFFYGVSDLRPGESDLIDVCVHCPRKEDAVRKKFNHSIFDYATVADTALAAADAMHPGRSEWRHMGIYVEILPRTESPFGWARDAFDEAVPQRRGSF